MNRDISNDEIISMFKRYISSKDSREIDKLKSEELIIAEARLGMMGINPDFREIIKNKIKDLQIKESRKYESKIRAWNLVTGLILGLTISGIASFIFNN